MSVNELRNADAQSNAIRQADVETNVVDPHPKGAYIDHVKLAVYGCNCSFCVQEMMALDMRRFTL